MPEVSDVSVVDSIVEAGVTTELHAVSGIRKNHILESGYGGVDNGSAAPESVNTGDIVVIDADTPQRSHNTGQVELEFLWVCTPRFEHQA